MGLGQYMQTSIYLEFEKPIVNVKDFETLFALCLYDDAFNCNLIPIRFRSAKLICQTLDSKRVYTKHIEYQAQCLAKLFNSRRVFLTPTDNFLYEYDEITPRYIYTSENIDNIYEDNWKVVKDAIWNQNLLSKQCVLEAIEFTEKYQAKNI